MLNLLGPSPAWRHAEATRPLPNTLPGWTIALLTIEGNWVSRERLLTLLWPEAASAEAQHNLRVNLHRARAVLAGWGLPDALEAERRRVRLSLPSDVAMLRRTLGEPPQEAPVFPGALLQSIDFAGFAALREWAELERRSLAEAWRGAAVAWAYRADATPAEVQAACQQMLQADALDEQALLRLLQSLHAQARFADVDRHYAAYRERLTKELGAEPSAALRAFAASTGTAASAPAEGAADAQAFIGRRLELAELARRLNGSERLITLVGPGGIGKSSLARRALGKLTEPATWIDLQDLDRIEAVAARIAQRLEIDLRDDGDAAAQIARGLGGEARVIALDNAEHLVDTLAPFAQRLLDAAPALKLLATSRQPLGLAAESLLPLEGLAVPDADSRDAEAAAAFDAVRLFELRARAARHGFELAPHIDAVVQIVDAVGGTPLAIELAATWVRLLPPAQIARDLRESIAVLERDPMRGASAARPEHASMRAVLERTCQLLGEREREGLAALTVFHGGFTPDAVQAVADAGLPLISTLLEKALLTSPAEGRFDLHPLVAVFARSQCDDKKLGQHRDRHAQHFATVAKAIASQCMTQPRDAIAAFSVEEANLREAWQHAWGQRRWADALPLSAAWRNCCEHSGRYLEAIAQLEIALTGEPTGTASQAAAARVRCHLSMLLMRRREIDKALSVARGGIELGRASGALREVICGLFVAGNCHLMRNQWSQAQPYFQQGLELSQEDGNREGVASALNNLGLCAKKEGHYDQAIARHEQAMVIYQEIDIPYAVVLCLLNTGCAHQARRDWPSAHEVLERGLRLCNQHAMTGVVPYIENGLGYVCLETGLLDAAGAHLQRALDLAVENAVSEAIWDARMQLARLSHRRGKHDDALERFRELARMADISEAAHDKFTLALYFSEYLRDTGRGAEAARLWQLVAEDDGVESDIRGDAKRNLAAMQAPESGDARHDTDLPTLLARLLPP